MARLGDSITYGNHAITGDINVGGTLTLAGVVFQQYQAGTGISLSGTTLNVDNPFNPSGTYSELRAQATTQSDVGLSDVDNYSRAHYDGRYLATGAKASDSDKLDGLNSSQFIRLDTGTIPESRLPASALIGDTNTTYSGGSGITLSGNTFNVDNPFNPSGSYASLRAQATTKADVGLGNVPDWSSGTFDSRYLATGAKAADSDKLDGLNSSQFIRLDTGTIPESRLPASALVGDTNTTYSAGTGISLSGTTFNVDSPFNPSGTYSGLRAQATTKADVGLGSVRNVSSYSQQEADNKFSSPGSTTDTSVNKTLAEGEKCFVSSDNVTITLPASPNSNSRVSIGVQNFVNTTVNGNGKNIMGLAENMTIDKENTVVTLLYVNPSEGWRIV